MTEKGNEWSQALRSLLQTTAQIHDQAIKFAQSEAFNNMLLSAAKFQVGIQSFLMSEGFQRTMTIAEHWILQLSDPEVKEHLRQISAFSEVMTEEDWDSVNEAFSPSEQDLLDELSYDELWPALCEVWDRKGDTFDRGDAIAVLTRKLRAIEHLKQLEEMETGQKKSSIQAVRLFWLAILFQILLSYALPSSDTLERISDTAQTEFDRIYAACINMIDEVREE